MRSASIAAGFFALLAGSFPAHSSDLCAADKARFQVAGAKIFPVTGADFLESQLRTTFRYVDVREKSFSIRYAVTLIENEQVARNQALDIAKRDMQAANAGVMLYVLARRSMIPGAKKIGDTDQEYPLIIRPMGNACIHTGAGGSAE